MRVFRRAATIGALGLVALCGLAPSALAGDVTKVGTVLTYTSTPGQNDDLYLSSDLSDPSAPTLTFDDHSVSVVDSAADCEDLTSSGDVTCDMAAVTQVVFVLDDATIFNFLDASLAAGMPPFSVTGGSGWDWVIGSPGADTVVLGDGDDIFAGNAGADVATGDDGDDNLAGNDGADTLTGGAGNDIMTGDADGDTLHGNDGDDAMSGGAGNDTISAGAGADAIDGDAGSDQVAAGDGDDTINNGSSVEADVYAGGLGADVLSYSLSPAAVTINLTSAVGNGGAREYDSISGDVESITGSGFNDSLTGNDLPNLLDGGAGNDYMSGGKGGDELIGGTGDDDIRAREAVPEPDIVRCEAGSADRAQLDFADALPLSHGCESVDRTPIPAPVVTTVTVPGPVTTITTPAPATATLPTTDGNDRVTGTRASEMFQLGKGNDILRAGAGNDFALGEAGEDQLYGGAGSDSLDGGVGADLVYGESGNDILHGGAGNDLILGGGGNDVIVGGVGRDRLQGNGGNDVIQAVDRRLDMVTCGAGRDVAIVDKADKVTRDCERVYRR